MLNLDIPSTCQIPGLEAIYYGVFGSDMSNRFFIEIGAYDGMTYSNTYGLAKAGWSGLYVEPIPHLADMCIGNHKDHPGIIVAEYACGDKNEYAPLFTDKQELYTLDVDFTDNLYLHSYVQVKTLDWLLDYYSLKNKTIDLLVIDVEGHELEVLNGSSTWPDATMIIIEAHEGHPTFGKNAREINRRLHSNGYHRIYSDVINNIYRAI